MQTHEERNKETARQLSMGLIRQQQKKINELTAILDATEMDLTIQRNRSADHETGYQLWRDIARHYKSESELLHDEVEALRCKIIELTKENES